MDNVNERADANPENVKCKVCQEEFKEMMDLYNHGIETKHPNNLAFRTKPRQVGNEESYFASNEQSMAVSVSSKSKQTKRIECGQCEKTFKTRDKLNKHKRKEHRGVRLEPEYKKPHILPHEISSLMVRGMKVREPPPAGFLKKQLPLVKVRYSTFDDNNRRQESTHWCSYEEVKRKFPREMCDFYISHTTFIEPPDN